MPTPKGHRPWLQERARPIGFVAALCFVAVFSLSALNEPLLSECRQAGEELFRGPAPDAFTYPLAAVVQTGAFALLWLSVLMVSWHWPCAARRAALLAVTASFLLLMHLWSAGSLGRLAGHFEFFLERTFGEQEGP